MADHKEVSKKLKELQEAYFLLHGGNSFGYPAMCGHVKGLLALVAAGYLKVEDIQESIERSTKDVLKEYETVPKSDTIVR